MAVRLGSSGPVAAHDLLDTLEDGQADQRLVLAGVLDTAPCDDTGVVAVLQDFVHLIYRQRLGYAGAGRPGHQAADRQLRSQLVQRPLAGGVGVKRPANVLDSVRVNIDGPDFAAVDKLPHVQVADRGQRRRPAEPNLGLGAFDDLGRQILAVELGDGTHDAVQQHAGRRLIDVLSAGDQPGTAPLDGQIDLDIIGTVPGQPIDLMHDDVADGLRSQVAQHPLQVRPVRRASRFSGIHVFGRY
ncbi:MAG TPA: hypothetical protein VJ851_15220 [Jatrophihabitans sp.]|nr:hypothetical protein [Jatrophihabitans sp.]